MVDLKKIDSYIAKVDPRLSSKRIYDMNDKSYLVEVKVSGKDTNETFPFFVVSKATGSIATFNPIDNPELYLKTIQKGPIYE